jgi:hypothetical protein
MYAHRHKTRTEIAEKVEHLRLVKTSTQQKKKKKKKKRGKKEERKKKRLI